MGAWKPLSSGGCNQPNPRNYKITNHYAYGNYLAVKINYPDSNNYEGNKILVYKDISFSTLNNQITLDPHFEEEGISPVARFVPTQAGWDYARLFCKMTYDIEKQL